MRRPYHEFIEPQARCYNKSRSEKSGRLFSLALCRTLCLTVADGTVICARCHDWNSAINDLFVVLASGEPYGHCCEYGDAAGGEDRDFHRDISCALRQAVWELLTNQKQKLLRPATERMAGFFAFVTKPHEKYQNEITALLD
jgi:hypothetical protein